MTQDMPPPQISVSIINYRTAEMTLDCVRSVLQAAADVPDITIHTCLLYTSPSPRDLSTSRMPSSA